MKTIKTTHIDTAGHGYLSVSKKDFLAAGLDPKKISGCSGHTLTRLYLEEDCDASYFMENTRGKGIEVEVKSGYNEKLQTTHGYKPELFDYQPQAGQILILTDDKDYLLVEVKENGDLIVENANGKRYRIPGHNPFEHITGVKA